MLKRLFCISIIIGVVNVSFAQRETVYQSAQWFAASSLLKIHKNYSIMAEGQFRYIDWQPMQFQARTGLEVHVSKQFSFMPLGYVYTWNPIYGKQPASYSNNEHRIFQQLQYTHKIGILNVGHRMRLEQRFIEVHSTNNGEVVYEGYTLYLNRLRYRLQVQIPINSKEIVPGTFYAHLYDELFLDFGANAIYNDPDQNRVFIGAGYKINSAAAIQAGYLDQLLIKLSGTKQEINQGFQIILSYNFDLTKKAE